MAELAWTDEQVAAILALDDTLLVANAGTGKTTTVVGKVLWLLGLPYGVDATSGKPLPRCPDPCTLAEIAAITFTEKAAYDLKRKLREAIEQSERAAQLRWQLDRASIGTIHSFCGALLREHALRLDIDPTFRVLDQNESWAAQDELIRELLYERLASGSEPVQRLLRRMRMSGSDFSSGAVDTVRCVMKDLRWHQARHQEWATGSGLDRDRLRTLAGEWDGLDDAGIQVADTLIRLAREAKRCWESWLQEENARDFDSLILDLRRLLQGSGGNAALEGVRRRFRILIIDEFQDTDVAQRDIAFQIGRNVPRPQLFLVGDPKQSIYRFRGADVSVWNGVSQELDRIGGCLALSRNFRCAPIIVDFVNAACGEAIGSTAAALTAEIPDSRIDYADLEPGVPPSSHSGVEWLIPAEGTVSEVRASAARHVVARIRELVKGRETISDPDTGERRPCQYSDIGVLYRSRTGLEYFETALSEAGIPYWLAGAPHLGERQEILDVLNVLRLLGNPRDDLRALGFLRSPLVCLRDEVIARIRQQAPRVPLLTAARMAIERDDWFEAPESPQLAHIEREALRRGLETVQTLLDLAPRVALDELVEDLLERTGYRMHLLFAGHAEEPLANLQSFLHFCGGYRELELGTFLEIWDRWSSQDLGIPQAPLYSKQDEVVTLTTVHAAKGLEWPVVFLVGVEKKLWSDPTNKYWTDRDLGPVLNAKKAERGPRNQRLVERDRLEAQA